MLALGPALSRTSFHFQALLYEGLGPLGDHQGRQPRPGRTTPPPPLESWGGQAASVGLLSQARDVAGVKSGIVVPLRAVASTAPHWACLSFPHQEGVVRQPPNLPCDLHVTAVTRSSQGPSGSPQGAGEEAKRKWRPDLRRLSSRPRALPFRDPALCAGVRSRGTGHAGLMERGRREGASLSWLQGRAQRSAWLPAQRLALKGPQPPAQLGSGHA